MTFPDQTYSTITDFADAYYDRLAAATRSLDRAQLESAAAILEAAYKNGHSLFVCGNGGSAAIAGTFVCDHAKLVQTDTDIVPRVISLSENVPMLTAIANDISYDEIFSYQLNAQLREGDVVLVISASGNSTNVRRAIEMAQDRGHQTIAMTGFDGGWLKQNVGVTLHIDSDNYGVIEDTHQSLMHILAQYIRLANMPPNLVAERKF